MQEVLWEENAVNVIVKFTKNQRKDLPVTIVNTPHPNTKLKSRPTKPLQFMNNFT